jgi:hypothetical protein
VLPIAYAKWGASYPGDGQQAFGVLIVFGAIGVLAALGYFAVGSLGQLLLRRRTLRASIVLDLVLFAVLTAVLAYGGVTATSSPGMAALHH